MTTRTPSALALVAALLSTLPAFSQTLPPLTGTRILYVELCSSAGCYQAQGDTLGELLEETGATIDRRLLTPASTLAANPADYDQIWVYDLSFSSDDAPSMTAAYTAIADWANARNADLIVDTRAIASIWTLSADQTLYPALHRPNSAVFNSYARALDAVGGGLVILTDHTDFSDEGAGDILGLIGVHAPANFSYAAPYLSSANPDSAIFSYVPHALFTRSELGLAPTWAGTWEAFLPSDASSSGAPTGLQPNGRTLHGVAHEIGSGPGFFTISTTLGGVPALTAAVSPATATVGTPAVTLSGSSDGGVPPYSYAWLDAGGTQIGTGATFSASLSPGTNNLTFRVTDLKGAHAEAVAAITYDPCLKTSTTPDFDNDGIIDACDSDDDNDGVPDTADLCPATPAGQAVGADGCTGREEIARLCPQASFATRKAWAQCVQRAALAAKQAGLLTGAEYGQIVSDAERQSGGR